MVKRYQQIRCQESGHDRDSLLLATLLPQEPRLLAFQARNSQCQPALLLHCYGNRPAALMTLQVFLFIWWIRGHYQRKPDTHTVHHVVSKIFKRYFSQSQSPRCPFPKSSDGSTLHPCRSLHFLHQMRLQG